MTGLTTTGGAPLQFSDPIAGIRAIQLRMFWLLGASGSIVFIEPSPFEVAMVLSVVFFIAAGLKMSPPLLVPLGLLIGLNIGYSIGALDLYGETTVLYWVLTSWYMAIIAMFFACALLEDTKARLESLSRGYVVGAIIASVAGIIGYFSLIPGAYALLPSPARLKGTFKDPNVLGPFLVYPAVYCMQRIIEGRFWQAARYAVIFGIIVITVFLAFSRAAWGVLAGATLMTAILMFAVAQTRQQRMRIVTLVGAALAFVVIAIVIMLSFDSIASIFKERASLHQPYDSGRFGRFGRHVLGAIMALDYPFGIGPLQFSTFFPEDTHNSFLNAFMSGGWMSGVIYPALIITTVIYGARCLFQRTPWQTTYIGVYSSFFMMALQSFIIDTDHWRHYYMLFGVTWGIAVASAKLARETPAR